VVVERFDAEPVADQHEPLVALVPQGEREHAVQPLRDAVAPLQVAPQHHFRVAGGAEPVPLGQQQLPQFREVVGLTGVDEGDGATWGVHRHRLPPTREVDDRQATMPQRHVPAQPHATLVRAPAPHRAGHRVDDRAPRSQIRIERDPAGDTAHVSPGEHFKRTGQFIFPTIDNCRGKT
jgi:hypothetical protein